MRDPCVPAVGPVAVATGAGGRIVGVEAACAVPKVIPIIAATTRRKVTAGAGTCSCVVCTLSIETSKSHLRGLAVSCLSGAVHVS